MKHSTKPQTTQQGVEPQSGIGGARQDRLATDPIAKLFLRFTVPMAIGMVLHGLYNLVDAFFITRYVGPVAMAGVSMVFPVVMLTFSLAAMISNGVSALVSRHLGANNVERANSVVAHAASAILFISVLTPLLTFLFLPQLLALLGINAEILPFAHSYLTPLISGCVLMYGLSLLNDLLRAQGKMTQMFMIILLSALSNIVLDALFVALLQWGTTGAAVATLLAQALALAFALYLYQKSGSRLQLPRPTLALQRQVLAEIFALGSPVMLTYIGVSLLIALVNITLSHAANIDNANVLGAYGVLGRINTFIALPLIAITSACQTIIAYNYGAGLQHRVQQSVRFGIGLAMTYLAAMAMLLLLFPNRVMSVFSDNPALVHQGALIAGTIFLALPLAGVSACSVAIFQAMGKARQALLLSSAKVYCFLIPGVLLIPKFFGVNALWYAYPLADVLAFMLVATLLFMHRGQLWQSAAEVKITAE